MAFHNSSNGTDAARDPGLTANEGPPLYIVDPNLKNVVGHYFEYDRAVAEGAREQGFRPVILAHRNVDPAIAAKVGAHPTFRDDIWASAGKPGTGLRRTIARVGDNLRFLCDLLRALPAHGLPPDTTIFAHTFIDRQMLGLALLPALLFRKPSIRFVLLLRYQPDFYESAVARLSFRLLEAFSRVWDIRLTTDSARLGEQLECLTSLPVTVLPIPHVPPDVSQAADPPDPRITRFVSLGNARDEKGMFEILDAIRILHRQGALDGLHFVLQCNDAAPDVAAAIEAFRQEAIPNCDLLFDKLDSADYYRILHQSDFVLLPYWRSIYTARTSGVFMEALSAGRPVIATRDTWMSDQLADHGAGLLCADRRPEALARVILSAAGDRDRLKRAALDRRLEWLITHNPDALVRAIGQLGQAPTPAHRPPRRVAVLYPHDDFIGGQGGASRRVNLMAEFLKSYVQEVRVLQSGEQPQASSNGIRVESLGPEPRRGLARLWTGLLIAAASIGKGMKHRWIFWQFARMRAIARYRRHLRQMIRWSDVVLLEYPFWARTVAELAHAEGRRVIVTTHDIIADQIVGMPALRGMAWRRELGGLRAADQVLAVSTDDQASLQAVGIPALLAPNPTDGRLFELDRLPAPGAIIRDLFQVALPAPRICLFVGSLFEPNVLAVREIRALEQRMRGRTGDDQIGFVVVGACAQPERDGNFVALGRVEDALLLALYAVCDLVLVPIPGGTGSSLKTVEAMAAGKVVLGTSAAFRGLGVTNGEQVLIEDDLSAYPDRIAAVLGDPDLATRMRESARGFARSYDSRVVYRAYLDVLGIPAGDSADPPETAGLIDATLLSLARDAMAAGLPDLARSLAAEVLRLAPDDDDAHAIIGAPQNGQGAALDGDPGLEAAGWAVLRDRIWEQFRGGDYDPVIQQCERLLPDNPSAGELHFLLAQSLHNQGARLDEARLHYTRAITAGHDSYWSLAGRARLHRDLGMPRAQLADLMRATLAGPRRSAIHGLPGEAMRAVGRLLKHRSDRGPVFAKDQPTAQCLARLWSAFHEGRFQDVVRDGEAWLAAPGSGEVHFLVAQSLHNGWMDLPRARGLYDEALRRGYAPRRVRLARGRLFYDLGMPANAMRDHLGAVMRSPFNADSRQAARRMVRSLLPLARPDVTNAGMPPGGSRTG
ncbi:MAG: glycosyltransferase [Acetobacteraceae bacterium]